MIRFVPISSEHEVIAETNCFAFYNTVDGRFIEIDNEHVFCDAEDVKEAYSIHGGDERLLERLLSLIPEAEVEEQQ